MVRSRITVWRAILLTVLTTFVWLAPGCSTDTIEAPSFAVGVSGPMVLDATGIGGPDQELPFQTGSYPDDFGIVTFSEEATDVVVVWSALPCQLEPVARVSSAEGRIFIEVTPGPNPVEHCAAMAIGYGLRLTFTEPVTDGAISAQLIDPVGRQLANYP